MATLTTIPQETGKRTGLDLKVADAVWIATADLHREYPDAPGFERKTIADRVTEMKLTKRQPSSVWQHIDRHCVANREAQTNRRRDLYNHPDTGLRRLFKPGDDFKPAREGAPYHPVWDDLPPQFRGLKAWYEEWCGEEEDTLLSLAGIGKDTWKGVDAVEYIRELREGWGE